MDERRDAEPAAWLVVTELEALKIMSDPLRIRLVDLLRQAPATAKQLAAALEVAPRSLYYHINLLERHGLIRVVATRLVSGIQEKTYRATAYLFKYDFATAPAGEAGQTREIVVSSFFHITSEEIQESIRTGRIDLAEDAPPDRALCSAWGLLRLTPEQIAALTARIEALLEEYPRYDGEPEDADSKIYRFLFTLFPTYRLGDSARRGATSEQ